MGKNPGVPDFPSELELAARIGLAFVLGGIVGFEREVNDQPAGLRTHIAVCLGACLFAIISAYGYEEFQAPRGQTNHQVDVTRIASQIVSGMGFLGGGAILKYGPNVRGLTTAASLWVTAAIGLAAAVGSYAIALVTTAAVLLSLVVLRFPKHWIEKHLASEREVVVIHLRAGADAAPVVAAAAALPNLSVRALHVERKQDELTLNLRAAALPGQSLEAVVAPLADRDEVVGLEVG